MKTLKNKLIKIKNLAPLALAGSALLSQTIFAADITVTGAQAQQLAQTLQQLGVQSSQDEQGGRVLLTREINCTRQVTQNVQTDCMVHEYTQDIRIQTQSDLASQLYQQLQSAGAQYDSDTPEETKVGVYMLSCYQSLRPDQSQCQGQAHN
jgi:hypothetical protein